MLHFLDRTTNEDISRAAPRVHSLFAKSASVQLNNRKEFEQFAIQPSNAVGDFAEVQKQIAVKNGAMLFATGPMQGSTLPTQASKEFSAIRIFQNPQAALSIVRKVLFCRRLRTQRERCHWLKLPLVEE